jgi:hypothetical protein
MAMSRYVMTSVAALCLLFCCAAKPKSDSVSKEPKMTKKIDLIDQKVLRERVAQGGSVALVRVARLEPLNEGTRSASVVIHLEVQRQLLGALPKQVNYWVWGSPEVVKIAPQLIVAVRPPHPGTEEIEMIAAVEVPEGKVEEAVQAHQQALAKLGKGPAPQGP